MTLVKICGITNLEDALVAVDAGADMLGFNFYARSPRYIGPEAARLIIDQLPEAVVSAGVFLNHTAEEIESIVSTTDIRVLQLHGDESPDYCHDLKLNGCRVMKVFNCRTDFEPSLIKDYDVELMMVDAAAGSVRGGTGRLSDWSKARQARELFPAMFLAGGLSPENVAAAIAEVAPFGVDACSSLELAPGKKDQARVRDFVAAVRRVTFGVR